MNKILYSSFLNVDGVNQPVKRISHSTWVNMVGIGSHFTMTCVDTLSRGTLFFLSFNKMEYQPTVLGFQVLFNFATLNIIGFTLKWRLTFGVHGHEHPHVDEERHIWLINSYLNVMFAAFAVDMFTPMFVLFPKKVMFSKFYIISSYFLIGAGVFMMIPIEEELKLHDLLQRSTLILYYLFSSLVVFIKIIWFLMYY